jgi:hypothetical protein
MDNEIKEQIIDGLTKTQWGSVARLLANDAGWLSVATLLSPAVAEANETLYNSQEPSRQNALHEAIGFLKFANKLSEIKDRARFISERGVSPDATIRNDPV